MLIDATHAEETRVVVVDGNKVEEFDFESENKRQLAGNIYLAKVTRVEPSLQAAFVDYGGNRHGFLAFSEIHPDYYQIPIADREALMEEERAFVEAQKARDEEDEKPKPRRRTRSRKPARAEAANSDDAVETREIEGMETFDTETGDAEGVDLHDGATGQDAGDQSDGDDITQDEDDQPRTGGRDAASRDTSIESVADDDDQEDIRPPRKPRPKRYKIQEVIKVRQILLVQVVKEERGNKGAALTTYLSLAGRYCVLMPNTARGGGISRKITNAVDRKKLKTIAAEIDVPSGAGLIVRTAGAKRTKSEIKRDYEYLQRMWEQIRELTLQSIAPAKIYEEGDLIKRSIRDLYNREIDEVLVEGERGYRIAKDFMKMIMPSHAKNVRHYAESMPLFARYQVESYLGGMFNPTVQLKSGGYIVIGVTEALVAIDVNSGRATKEGSIEETATKTNLEAAEEVARQLRLRDLAGLIVIDFIDMDERKNNNAVEKKLKDKLKTDRARIQVGRISGFGLMEMSRQRLRPGMIEATTQPCPACHGTGLIRSDDSMALSILRQIEEEGVRRRSREVLVKCPVGIANYLMNQKREHVGLIEARYGLSVRIEGDPHLVSPDFTLEKLKTAIRNVPEPTHVVSADMSLMEKIDNEPEVEEDEAPAAEVEEQQEARPAAAANGDDDQPRKKRRRRRRRRKPGSGEDNGSGDDIVANRAEPAAAEAEAAQADAVTEAPTAETAAPEVDPASAPAAELAQVSEAEALGDVPSAEAAAEAAPEAETEKPKRTRKPATRSRRKKAEPEAAEAAPADGAAQPEGEATADAPEEKPKPKRTRKPAARTRKKKEPEAAESPAEAPATEALATEAQATEAPQRAAEPAPEPAALGDAAPKEAEPALAEATPEPEADESPKPKRRGWWSLGRS